ncbi:competence/damage-inducible protein A [Geoalkalibacter halelectricus]|uniref:competence/damage-inducible protein A n=1 Tax=Geoalkalibacter halelectricus TaxID=2847045 RepID=UPI003D25278E
MNLDIAVLAVGDELLNGEIPDTNTAAIARLLNACGYRIREGRTLPDQEEAIAAALRELTGRHQVVVVTGGLGPTRDDLTARAAARAFGRQLVLNDEALALIRAFFRDHDLEMDPRNEKQALLPHKCTVLPNLRGTAPGFLLEQEHCLLLFFPGVPEEMEAMVEAELLPRLDALSGGHPPLCERILKIFGLSEPKTESLLEGLALPEGVSIGFGVDFPLVHLKLRATGAAAEELLDRAEVQVQRRIGDFIVARGRETLPQTVARLLSASGLTLSLAESCTGGLVAAWLTDIPGASTFFDRGAVTYSNQAKNDWLAVSKRILHDQGAVSETCARAMATGLRQSTRTDITVAVTGIAGPDGGSEDKPVGTVFIALSANDAEQAKGYRFSGSREQIRKISACMALEWIRRYLMERARPKA